MYELTIEAEFSAAHRLREYNGACENLHGHNWRVELVVGGQKLGPLGMLMDFRDLKQVLKTVLDRYDHKYINEIEEFTQQNPTTENLAREIHRQCSERMPEGISVRSVSVWESSKAGARYTESDGSTR